MHDGMSFFSCFPARYVNWLVGCVSSGMILSLSLSFAFCFLVLGWVTGLMPVGLVMVGLVE